MNSRLLTGDTMFTLRIYNMDLELQLISCGLTILTLELQFFFKQLILLVQEIQYTGMQQNLHFLLQFGNCFYSS